VTNQSSQSGKGFLGWLGRQVGYVTKAVKTEVPPPPTKLYENKTVQESPHPQDPNVRLRRTVIDEAIVAPPPAPPKPAGLGRDGAAPKEPASDEQRS
jgi:hypothetical protein